MSPRPHTGALPPGDVRIGCFEDGQRCTLLRAKAALSLSPSDDSSPCPSICSDIYPFGVTRMLPFSRPPDAAGRLDTAQGVFSGTGAAGAVDTLYLCDGSSVWTLQKGCGKTRARLSAAYGPKGDMPFGCVWACGGLWGPACRAIEF